MVADPTPATLAACLIVKDEQERLPAALASVAFCDEVVVVDSGSRDRTVEIARSAGARVAIHPWRGFAAQRNLALDEARAEWVLELDADERVSPRLRASIEAFLADPPRQVDMALLPRRNIFLGRALGSSAKYPEYRARLFRRGAYRHDERRQVHEGLEPRCPLWPLEGDLEHVLAKTVSEAVTDTLAYARLDARHVRRSGSPVRLLVDLLGRPVAKAGYRLIVDGGWRDGWQGWLLIALASASDVVVWLHAIRAGRPRGAEPRAAVGHFGRSSAPVGPVHLVAVAAGPGATADASRWIAEASDGSADVALITDCPEQAHGIIRVHALGRMGPLLLIRALAREEELSAIEGVVAFGAAARALTRLLPGHLRGNVRGLSAGTPARTAVRRVRTARA